MILGDKFLYLIFPPSHGDLHSYVRQRKRLKETEAKRLFKQIVETVRACHEQGIVLRDLKLRKFVFADSQRFVDDFSTRTGSFVKIGWCWDFYSYLVEGTHTLRIRERIGSFSITFTQGRRNGFSKGRRSDTFQEFFCQFQVLVHTCNYDVIERHFSVDFFFSRKFLSANQSESFLKILVKIVHFSLKMK